MKNTNNDLVAELSNRMEVISIPGNRAPRVETIDMTDLPSREAPTQPPPLTTPDPKSQRPWDVARNAGPPADPIDFDAPRIARGRRAEVTCYIPATGRHQLLKNVLFRDFSRECDFSELRQAYYPIPYKKPIKTIMGVVEICIVLERCKRQQDEDDSTGSDDDEDIVFQLTDHYVAVKVNYCARMERLKNHHAEDPQKEIAAMQLIGDQHPNVLGCMEVLFDGENLNVVMRYCDKGDLFQLLQDTQQSVDSDVPGLSEEQSRYWFRQFMAGVKHLHSIGICHRDLSPENVMIDGNGCLIIDMGMCLRVPYTDPQSPDKVTDRSKGRQKRLFSPQGACGKLPYMSPEIYRNRHAFDGEAADIWTAGTIFFCMVTGNRSYQRPHRTDAQFYWMAYGLPQLLSDWNINLSPEGLHLLRNMLHVDPRLRLTIDEVINHPWFSYPDPPMQFL